jgi:aerobic C4-dicarboxylate transport protein
MNTHKIPAKKPAMWKRLWFQILVAILAGVLLGHFAPNAGKAMKPLGDGFIALIRMMIAPIIFCTIVHGIGSMRDMRRVGRIGLKALIYFETVSTFALVLGIAVAHLTNPGQGFSSSLPANATAVQGFVKRAAEDTGVVGHLMAIIPTSFFDAFASGDLLQMLLISILTGTALAKMGDVGHKISKGIDNVGQIFFKIVGFIVYVAPIGAFGAMAFTVGNFGTASLVSLGYLIGIFFLTAAFFVFVVLNILAYVAGFSLLRYLKYMREELVIAFATASSETVLPSLMRKLERAGVSEATVGLVVPTGYSFNLDGTNIYMTLAILFLAQVTGTDLSFSQELTIIVVTMLTSKGAAGVTGAGFVVLAATLTLFPQIPIESLGLLLGIDRFMSIGRTLTNFIGNGVATIVVARWEGELDRVKLAAVLSGKEPVAELPKDQLA